MKKKPQKHYVFIQNEIGQEGTDFESNSQYVNCISDFAFLPVNCSQSFSCAKKEA